MTDYATKKDVQEVVDDLSKIISQLAQNMHSELTDIKQDVKTLQGDVTYLKKGHDKLLDTLDHFFKRLDETEADNTARDAQLARLERWIEQVAAKAGVKLEY
jgi:septal ring factor EnvC (AmiA/AmiB activator)